MTKKRSKKKFKLEVPFIIASIIVIGILIGCYSNFGIELTAFLAVGILIIVGIARLLDKVKYNKKRRRILNFLLIFFFLIAITICVGIGAFCVMIVKEAPDFDISKLTKREASILYDKDGNEFARLGKELRENVSYDDLPEVFIDALIATEDSRFFQHNGFDAPRFIKASFGQALGDSGAGGASTLSMQLIKNTYTDTDLKRSKGLDGVIRKFEDIYLAVFKLEKNYTKEEIIEYYVNNYDLANNAWGVEQASQTYFSKSVTDLNLSEAATLVGIFNNPNKFNPLKYPKNCQSRRNTVLNLMANHGYITWEEANMAKSIPLESILNHKETTRDYQAYIDTVYNELKDKYGINPNTTSVLVYTNMDKTRQKGIDEIFNTSNVYKWIDDIVQGAAAVVEVNTGKIVAIGGGRNKTTALSFNFATEAKRQIGSSAKPIFDYGPAIEYLNWSTYQQVVDEPWTYSTGQAVANSDGGYQGQISIREALAGSRNVPAVKTFQEVQSKVGNNKIYEFATNLGIKPQVAKDGTIYESHALGAFDGTTPLQMAAAYAAFANGGTYYEPTTINKIVYRDTNDVKTIKVEGKKAMSEATAFMMTDMLITAVNNGVSSGAKVNNVVVAAKTGTSNYDKATKTKYNLPSNAVNDSWIVGYDVEYSIGMWWGYEKIDSKYCNKTGLGSVERGKLFRAIGNVIFNKNNKEFEVPNSVERICVEKGHMNATLPSAYTPEDQITCEYFKKGSEPTETSTAYNKLDSVTNLKVSYDSEKEKITITWSPVQIPSDSEEAYGDFGYNVYYEDVLLDFTTSNSYTINANTNISGTYKVVTTYSVYTNNQSDPAIYKFEYKEPEPEPIPEETETTTDTTENESAV